MPSPPYPHLIVRRAAVKPTPLTSTRNMFAIQSALIRGDRVVTLHNTTRLLPEHYKKVRVPYEPKNMPQDRPFEWPFGDQYDDSRSSDTVQPRVVDNYIDLLNWDGFRLEWIKVLGEGGFGMATLWDAIFEDQSRVKVVIKIPVRVNADFDSELDWHLRYGGASHVTQSLDLQAMADGVRRRINRGHMVGRGPRFAQTDLSVLVLEYAERGSLYEMMAKASYFGINFSNKALWEIWECFLVSEDAQHLHHPIFKLHDFGEFSKRMRECWLQWTEDDYWKVRKCPKPNRTAPETISKEWDKPELIDLIVQCQFEKPEDRPHLGYLLRKIQERKYRGFQEADDETRYFWDSFWARTKTNPNGFPTAQPLVPLSQASTIAASSSGARGNNAAGQGPNAPFPSTLPLSQSPIATNPNTASPSSPSRYAQTGNPLIAHVATLRRKSRRSPLSVSSTESSISLQPRSNPASGQHAAGINPAANLPHSSPNSTGTNQRKRSVSDDDSSSEDSSGQAKKQKRVRFGGSQAPTSLAMATAPRDIMDDSMDDSPGSLNRAWPVVVSNAPGPVPNILDGDVDGARNLTVLYSAISPQRVSVPQNNGDSVATGSPRSNSGRRGSRSSQLQQQWNYITGPVTTSVAAFTPLQVIPENRSSHMDLDED
ncbi:hypothetical protein TARUN_7307 [Trichoderma arundinaceum]|uniref:Protein kinase domain-containing protein n=1 Tax=Trichoderma arundinaceum TaxID=490622 RepID=A0A395NG51_TRIAR|nr:hypothetical protein TARUN_7307 [Trichoderma arundinaceum]